MLSALLNPGSYYSSILWSFKNPLTALTKWNLFNKFKATAIHNRCSFGTNDHQLIMRHRISFRFIIDEEIMEWMRIRIMARKWSLNERKKSVWCPAKKYVQTLLTIEFSFTSCCLINFLNSIFSPFYSWIGPRLDRIFTHTQWTHNRRNKNESLKCNI